MYPSDFEAKTSHLTLEEDGAYNRLLRLMWMTPGCSLPDDDAWVARRMRVSTTDFHRVILPIIAEFMVRKGGRIVSPRLREEFEKADVTYKLRSEAGKKGGRPKAIDNKQNDAKAGLSQSKAGPKQPEPEPEPLREIGKPISMRVKEPDRFDEFWASVPKKAAKADAVKAYAKALKTADAETIISGMRAYAETRRDQDPQYTAHPSSWLNAGRWSDVIQTEKGTHDVRQPSTSSKSADRVAAFISGAR